MGKIEFSNLTEHQKIDLLFSLISEQPGLKGSQYAEILKMRGFQVDTSSLNKFLYNRQNFEPNLNEQGVPAWTTVSVVNSGMSMLKNETSTTAYNIFETESLYDWQRAVLEKWKANNSNGYANASRRTGKTFLARLIAYDHALNVGPVLVAVNTLREIDSWTTWINQTNERSGISIKAKRLDSNHVDLLTDKSIMIGTVNSLSTTKFRHENILFIIEHLELLDRETGVLLNPDYKFRLGFSNSKPDRSFSEYTTKKQYFNMILVDYTLTEAMLDDNIQKFEINFSSCKYFKEEETKVLDLFQELSTIYKDFKNKNWINVYEEISNFNKESESVDILEEIIEKYQDIETKFDYLETKAASLSNYKRVVIFCESEFVITRAYHLLNSLGINTIVYSTSKNLEDLSQSPHTWQDEVVLITDHIKYMTNYELGEIDYVLIFGTLGNSLRLKQKIETVISDKFKQKKLKIDVLYVEGSIEDPYRQVEAYFEFKEYLKKIPMKFETPHIEPVDSKKEKSYIESRSKTKNILINLDISKILIYCPDERFLTNKQILKSIELFNLNSSQVSIQTYKNDDDNRNLVKLINTSVYSDVLIMVDKDSRYIEELKVIEDYLRDINIKIYFSDVTYAYILKFLNDSKLVNHLKVNRS